MPQQIDHEVLIASTCWTTSAQVLSWELDGYYCTGIDQYQKKAGGELSAKLSFQRRQNILGDILLTEVRNGLQCRKKKTHCSFPAVSFFRSSPKPKREHRCFLATPAKASTGPCSTSKQRQSKLHYQRSSQPAKHRHTNLLPSQEGMPDLLNDFFLQQSSICLFKLLLATHDV